MKYGLKQLRKDFPNDQACLQFAFDTLHSAECSCGGRNVLMSTQKQYYCTKCRKQTAVLVGTIFERSLIPLTKWFEAILLIEERATAKDIQRMTNCTYKTAHRMKRLILENPPIKAKGKLRFLRVRASPIKAERKVAVVA